MAAILFSLIGRGVDYVIKMTALIGSVIALLGDCNHPSSRYQRDIDETRATRKCPKTVTFDGLLSLRL